MSTYTQAYMYIFFQLTHIRINCVSLVECELASRESVLLGIVKIEFRNLVTN